MLQQIIFAIVTIVALGWAFKQYSKIRRNILFGKEEEIKGDAGKRWKNVFLIALGQKKMWKNWIPGLFHLFIYVAFLITVTELIEIFVDGFTGHHRFFAASLGGFYTFVISSIEVLSILAFIATVIFLIRRNVLKVKRFEKPEMTRWPKLDANLILLLEILLIISIMCMNGADTLLQDIHPSHYPETGELAVSSWMGPALFGEMSESSLTFLERFGWWLHIIVVFIFLNYLPISKHFHILLAFPNTYFAKLTPKGQMENMPEIMNEVKSMMGLTEGEEEMPMEEELPEFGANDIFSLSWKNLLDAYTCTECGRCTANCPPNITGKKLSPRKVMMNVRDRVEEVSKNIDNNNLDFVKEELKADAKKLTKENYDDGKSLFDYISAEELHACTTCNACVEQCPVLINPLDVILKMRRYEILTLSQGPADWLPMFNSIENSGSAWQIPQERDAWAKEL
ncbi:MAG: (Fe-S)-binding protein [Bacteroidetes bacterium]|nr:(Fe-S)-binding protein [Bacteroidota bacterium]